MLLAVTVFVVAVLLPTWSTRSKVVLATPVAESESERLRVVNSVSRWDTARTPEHGTILPRVEKKMSEEVTTRRVNPNDLRSLASARARARARVSQRQARAKAWMMGVGVAVLVTLIVWILALTTAFPTALAIIATVLTIAGGVFVGMMMKSAQLATGRDEAMIAKIDTRLAKLTERARTQDKPVSAASAKKAPRKVVEARKASAESAKSAISAESPAVAALPEAVSAASPAEATIAPVAPAPTYTPKPVYTRPNIKPFVPEEAPTAAVPYRPKALGERFEGATSAASADAAPTIGTISFDAVLENRKRA